MNKPFTRLATALVLAFGASAALADITVGVSPRPIPACC